MACFLPYCSIHHCVYREGKSDGYTGALHPPSTPSPPPLPLYLLPPVTPIDIWFFLVSNGDYIKCHKVRARRNGGRGRGRGGGGESVSLAVQSSVLMRNRSRHRQKLFSIGLRHGERVLENEAWGVSHVHNVHPLRASLSGILLQTKDVVNPCLEF